jgi:hypothetical protein
MKSNIGFLQILVLVGIVLSALGALNTNSWLMAIAIVVAWVDSYIIIDDKKDTE